MNMLTWGDVLKSLAFWGPGAVIAGILILAVFKLAKSVGLEFVRAQRELADATSRQAQSMEGLKESMQMYVLRDNTEHREMLVLLKYVSQHQQAFEQVRREHAACDNCNGSEKETHEVN